MTSMDPGPWQMNESKTRPACLYAVSVNPLTFCTETAEKGKIFCKKHVGKKQYQEAKS